MIKDSSKVTMRGMVEPGGKLRLDGPVPVKPGPVDVTVRPVESAQPQKAKGLSILDLAGSAREMLRDVDVDKKLDELRDEWHKDPH